MKTITKKIVSGAIIAGILVFLAFIAPAHLAELNLHDHCTICQFIRHTPLVKSEAVTVITRFFIAEWFLFIFDNTAFSDIRLKSSLSRAPPTSCHES